MQSLDPGRQALFPARSTAAQGCGSPGTAACEGVGWGCQHFAKYSPVSMETGSPHLKLQCSRCSPLTGLMGDEKLMFDLHLIAVLWDHSPGPSAGVAQSPGRLPLAVEPKSPNPAPPVPAAGCCGACAAMLGPTATARSFGLSFGLVKGWSPRGAAAGVGMAAPGAGAAPAAPREHQHGVPAWQSLCLCYPQLTGIVINCLLFLCCLESLTALCGAVGVKHSHLAEPRLQW